MIGETNDMKLAEALQERADLSYTIDQLNTRLLNNACVQEGEKPAEDPKELLATLDAMIIRLRDIIARINKTNCNTIVDGLSITDLIARRDTLKLQLRSYRDLANRASQTATRASRTEIKILSTVDVPALQKKVNELSKCLRETDNKIQEMNWKTDLMI